jgi:hypothetical protein
MDFQIIFLKSSSFVVPGGLGALTSCLKGSDTKCYSLGASKPCSYSPDFLLNPVHLKLAFRLVASRQELVGDGQLRI